MVGATARNFERLAEPLLGSLRFAAGAGSLDVVTRSAIGEKYTHLDDIVDVLHAKTNEPRVLPTWQGNDATLGVTALANARNF
jgi:hypothetical protein